MSPELLVQLLNRTAKCANPFKNEATLGVDLDMLLGVFVVPLSRDCVVKGKSVFSSL